MEDGYAAAGVTHFMVDGPSLHGDTALGRPSPTPTSSRSARDLQVSYRVWSPKSGYPGHAAYRDFHTYDHVTGLKPARVTGRSVPSEDKAPYDPERADHAVDVHVADFVDVVRSAARLRVRAHRQARPRRRGVRHRTLRTLVARGPGVAGARTACAARGRRAGGYAVRRDRRRLRRLPRRIAAQLLGFRQGLAGVVGRAGRRPRATQRRGGRHRTRHRRQGARRRTRRSARPPHATWSPTRSCARRC